MHETELISGLTQLLGLAGAAPADVRDRLGRAFIACGELLLAKPAPHAGSAFREIAEAAGLAATDVVALRAFAERVLAQVERAEFIAEREAQAR